MIVSKENTVAYTWGSVCQGWQLLNSKELSIIQEVMPPGTKEVLHHHRNSQQFFFVLKGKATFIIQNQVFEVGANEGIHIKPNSLHRIKNESDIDLEFLVVSQPHAHGDRIVA